MIKEYGVDFDRAIKQVLSSDGQVSFKRQYKLDVDKYSWVPLFVRDQQIRKEIEGLQQEIAATRLSLIDRDELRAMFDAGVEQAKANFLELLRDHLSRAQRHEEAIIGGLQAYGVIKNELHLAVLLLALPEDIEEIIQGLPEGMRRKDIEKKVQGFERQIAKLNETIEKELSPKGRWFYDDAGNPLGYPQGCRWSLFVDGWRKVQKRYDGKVDIEGCTLRTEEEFNAFYALGFERLDKITPLRPAWQK
jgi:hypothetical protein